MRKKKKKAKRKTYCCPNMGFIGVMSIAMIDYRFICGYSPDI